VTSIEGKSKEVVTMTTTQEAVDREKKKTFD